jgi:hypothetical protein
MCVVHLLPLSHEVSGLVAEKTSHCERDVP